MKINILPLPNSYSLVDISNGIYVIGDILENIDKLIYYSNYIRDYHIEEYLLSINAGRIPNTPNAFSDSQLIDILPGWFDPDIKQCDLDVTRGKWIGFDTRINYISNTEIYKYVINTFPINSICDSSFLIKTHKNISFMVSSPVYMPSDVKIDFMSGYFYKGSNTLPSANFISKFNCDLSRWGNGNPVDELVIEPIEDPIGIWKVPL